MSTNRIETDPRFPSGQWRGYWTQRGFNGWMELALSFCDGRVRGDGMDPVGSYVMRGHYDLDTGKVVLRKHYLNQHMVAYTGFAGTDGHLRGQWEIRCCHEAGPWRLWPRGQGGEAQAVTGMADYPHVITDWDEFKEWVFESIDEKASSEGVDAIPHGTGGRIAPKHFDGRHDRRDAAPTRRATYHPPSCQAPTTATPLILRERGHHLHHSRHHGWSANSPLWTATKASISLLN